MSLKIKVPATSANLGPGFDCFGIAWNIFNEFEYDFSDTLKITGCPEKYQNENNLAYKSYQETLKYAGKEPHPISINFLKYDVPISRGLGSSATLICSGIISANKLDNLNLTDEQLLYIATKIEGHPDNVAPALFGGLVVSTMEENKPIFKHFNVSERLKFTALVPPFELSTEKARAVLPKEITRTDAIFNISHSALLLKALEEGDMDLLKIAMQDRIHQPYRSALIMGYDDVKADVKCISGAGSTILCIGEVKDYPKDFKKIDLKVLKRLA